MQQVNFRPLNLNLNLTASPGHGTIPPRPPRCVSTTTSLRSVSATCFGPDTVADVSATSHISLKLSPPVSPEAVSVLINYFATHQERRDKLSRVRRPCSVTIAGGLITAFGIHFIEAAAFLNTLARFATSGLYLVLCVYP